MPLTAIQGHRTPPFGHYLAHTRNESPKMNPLKPGPITKTAATKLRKGIILTPIMSLQKILKISMSLQAILKPSCPSFRGD